MPSPTSTEGLVLSFFFLLEELGGTASSPWELWPLSSPEEPPDLRSSCLAERLGSSPLPSISDGKNKLIVTGAV